MNTILLYSYDLSVDIHTSSSACAVSEFIFFFFLTFYLTLQDEILPYRNCPGLRISSKVR
jgi:hypothetical protein